jgi:multiple sugar transport system substrate-binding protein
MQTNQNIIAEFQKKYPNVDVELVELPTETDKKLQTMSTILQAKDSSMDVFDIDCTWPLTFISAGWVEKLDDVLGADEVNAHFEGARGAGTYGGSQYTMPHNIDIGTLFYRKDLLDKYGYQSPKTWAELVTISKDIMSKEPEIKNGFSSAWRQYEALVCCALEFIWGAGGDILDENGTLSSILPRPSGVSSRCMI